MKKILFPTLLLICLACYGQDTLLIKLDKPEYKYKIAAVEKHEGINVFVESKPIARYKKIGEVEEVFIVGDFTSIIEQYAEKAVRKYPEAEGIILHFKDRLSPWAEVIVFE